MHVPQPIYLPSAGIKKMLLLKSYCDNCFSVMRHMRTVHTHEHIDYTYAYPSNISYIWSDYHFLIIHESKHIIGYVYRKELRGGYIIQYSLSDTITLFMPHLKCTSPSLFFCLPCTHFSLSFTIKSKKSLTFNDELSYYYNFNWEC